MITLETMDVMDGRIVLTGELITWDWPEPLCRREIAAYRDRWTRDLSGRRDILSR